MPCATYPGLSGLVFSHSLACSLNPPCTKGPIPPLYSWMLGPPHKTPGTGDVTQALHMLAKCSNSKLHPQVCRSVLQVGHTRNPLQCLLTGMTRTLGTLFTRHTFPEDGAILPCFSKFLVCLTGFPCYLHGNSIPVAISPTCHTPLVLS